MKFFAATALAAIVSATSIEKGTMQMGIDNHVADVDLLPQGLGKFRSHSL
jgi:hypothetical protein